MTAGEWASAAELFRKGLRFLEANVQSYRALSAAEAALGDACYRVGDNESGVRHQRRSDWFLRSAELISAVLAKAGED